MRTSWKKWRARDRENARKSYVRYRGRHNRHELAIVFRRDVWPMLRNVWGPAPAAVLPLPYWSVVRLSRETTE